MVTELMNDKNGDHLKPVGGFAEVIGVSIPDLSLPDESDVFEKPSWDAKVYVYFRHNERLIESLTKVIDTKLKGRRPHSNVGKDIEGNQLLLIQFWVSDDEVAKQALVTTFAEAVSASVSEVSQVLNVMVDVGYVGDEMMRQASLRVLDDLPSDNDAQ